MSLVHAKTALLTAGALAVASCGAGAAQPADAAGDVSRIVEAADVAPPAGAPRTTAPIIGESGEQIGEITLINGPHGVLATLAIAAGSLSPGWHGVHIHQVGDCSDTGTFKEAESHLGKIEGGHGLLNPDGPETGDLPNLHAPANGPAAMQFFSERLDFEAMEDTNGAALVIHETRDDHSSQPIGGAGARVACAVLGQ